jgi:hypothetical protein
METCDLLAVPGSGKTTALQAKLYCVCQSMPLHFNKWQGILVLSHTNVAVAEIRNKLLIHCPDLFEYPNFVGTVQDFVDTFLAIPYYKQKYGKAISRIDSAIYQAEFIKQFKNRNGNRVWLYYRNRMSEKYAAKIANEFDIKVNRLDSFTYWNYSTDKVFNVVGDPPKTWKKEDYEPNRKHILSVLQDIKTSLWRSGILNYNDCYSLATSYVLEHPMIKQILCERFPMVFIDETQDLQAHQLEIIDRIFMNTTTCIQRVGDINQSIFHQGSEGRDCPWQLRDKCRTFNKSFRLTKNVGNAVSSFAKKIPNTYFNIDGIRTLEHEIPPYILVYDFEHRNELIDRFIELIKLYDIEHSIESNLYGFHVIGWNVQWKDHEEKDINKLRLCDLYNEYAIPSNTAHTTFDTIWGYIYSAKDIHDSYKLNKIVVNIVCESLRRAGYYAHRTIKGQEYTVPYSTESLSKLISSQPKSFIDRYNLLRYFSIKSLHNFDYTNAYNSIMNLIQELFNQLNIEINSIAEFVDEIGKGILENAEDCVKYSVNLAFDNVHNVKGQTHCATLYIESSYQGKYEAQHLIPMSKGIPKKNYSNPFYGENEKLPAGAHANSALKIIYVGMSRPTHLLCYAMHKSSYELYDKGRLEKSGWVVEDLTSL